MSTPRDVEYPIRPEHIDLNDGLYDTFDSHGVDTAALIVIRLCQKRGNWSSFSKAELCDHLEREGLTTQGALLKADEFLTTLSQGRPRYLLRLADDTFQVNHQLVATAFAKHPARPKQPASAS